MLNNIQVASPCRASWEKMQGNERVRHCPACNLNVYNFAAMSEREVRAVIASNEGRLCARLFRRQDGTVLTQNCPAGFNRLKRRLSRIAGLLLSAMAPSFASAQQALQGYVKTNVSDAALEVYVVDPQGTPIPNATVTLRDSMADKKENQAQKQTDSRGRARISRHAAGTYFFTLASPGFQTHEESVELRSGEMLSLHVLMTVAASMGEVIEIKNTNSEADLPVRHVSGPGRLCHSLKGALARCGSKTFAKSGMFICSIGQPVFLFRVK